MPVATVRFMPSTVAICVSAGTTLFTAALEARLPLGSSCRGAAACGWCRVWVLEGRENLSAVTDREQQLLVRTRAAAEERIACLAEVQASPQVAATWGW
jgi:ferredoxin